MTTVFKSPFNKRADTINDAQVATQTVELASNISTKCEVEFARPFKDIPLITYSILCNDDLFGLSHCISGITPTKFTISIENQIADSRTIIITYKAELHM